jgi:putative phosphotransacetylase
MRGSTGLTGDVEIQKLSEEVAERVKARLIGKEAAAGMMIPVGISGRHLHLTREVLEGLFGRGYELTKLRDLSQPGEFAANETVTIIGPRGRAVEGVRLLGPTRKYTQVELARSDGLRLGLELPVRKTGDLSGTPGLTVVGPRGTVVLKEGAIRPTRHIHMAKPDGARYGLSDGQKVRVRVGGPSGLIFDNVLVRVSDRYALDFHLDTDDANAAGLNTGDLVEILV